ncbi:DUF2167 domain-containing protein [Humisphaera borealis]|uniref:DUF2167 domain-containing protein n=1 Tax=Humisphaera borealis TaxID=2807512 RepID=A0A7M2WVK4_9BACT|nr:DUF2167 domain-containing protein [Humisphaera borealis]QOV88871.1 DUF2167 domain-containing protein [Humisphaera borealis]
MAHTTTIHRRLTGLLAGLALALLAIPSGALAQSDRKEINDRFKAIEWVTGPGTGDLGNATIKVPAGYRFTGASGAEAYCHYTGNNYGGEVGVLEPVPGKNASDFFILFTFDGTGYVKDDEKSKLDDEFAETLLKQFKEGTDKGNAERASRGAGPIHVTGWNQKPFYDDQTKNLTWAVIVSGQGGASVNYESKVLGRRGVMAVNMVVDQQAVAKTIPEYRKLVSGLNYKAGDTYSEFREGDKIAEYGLIGLASGGIAIAAIKWWKPLMQFGIFIIAGVGIAIKKVFSMFKSKPASV